MSRIPVKDDGLVIANFALVLFRAYRHAGMGNNCRNNAVPNYKKIIVQLRGEIGEVIHTWVLLRHFLVIRAQQTTGAVDQDMDNQDLWFLDSIVDKLENEAIARLSELAKPIKRGRLNLENSKSQLGHVGLYDCTHEVKTFREFIKKHRFEEKRNSEISHKKFVEEWKGERASIHIPYRVLLRAVALVVRAMKRMDREIYGEIHGKFIWRELRDRRYSMKLLPRVGYMIAEYIRLPETVRAKIIETEIRLGKFHQELMDAEVNGVKVKVYASRKWGAINLGGHLMILQHYPLQSIGTIEGENIVVDPAWYESEALGSETDSNDL